MKVAIIGGGIGGLTTALLLSKQGVEVTIFEKAQHLGGRLSFVKEDGYRIDKGPTIVLLPDMIKNILAEAGISPASYELIKCDPLYQIHFADGSSYLKYDSLEKQRVEIESLFPQDVQGFDRFMTDMELRFNLGKPNFLEKPFLKTADFWNHRTLSLLAKLKAYRSVYKQLSEYFQDEKLRIAYALQTLYVGGNPLTTPAIYSLVSFSEHQHGIYYLKGGYASLVETLENELKSRGVTIRTNSPVDQIRTDGRQATTLTVHGHEESFDFYVMNGDFPVAQKELLGKEKKFTASSACLLLYFGIDKKYEQALTHQFFIGTDFKDAMCDIFDRKKIPNSPSYYTFYPSAIDDTLAPNGKSVLYTLVPVPSGEQINWEVEGPILAEKIIDHLERHGFPALRKHLAWKKVRTPKEAMAEGLYSGGSFGIAPELFQSAVFRPQLKPYVEENVLAVGASIHPGGGIPIVMQGAKMLSDYIVAKKKINEKDVMKVG